MSPHFGSRDVIGHQSSISYGFRDIEPQIFRGHDLDRLGSRDHKIRSGWFPIGGPLTPTLYLASLLRYYASSVR